MCRDSSSASWVHRVGTYQMIHLREDTITSLGQRWLKYFLPLLVDITLVGHDAARERRLDDSLIFTTTRDHRNYFLVILYFYGTCFLKRIGIEVKLSVFKLLVPSWTLVLGIDRIVSQRLQSDHTWNYCLCWVLFILGVGLAAWFVGKDRASVALGW
jgi:hypothetical protein